jgi:Replication Fork Protection Component Swi3
MSTAIDTSAEDATEGAREGQQTINADGVELEAATPQDEDAAKKAKKKRAPALSESHLVGPHGLIRIEKDFPERLKPCVKGREREWLRQLMFLYKVRLSVTHKRAALAHANFACCISVDNSHQTACLHVVVYAQEWGYSLYPNMSFEDLAARIETLGGRERVRGHLSVMRDVERDRYVRDKHGEEAVQVCILLAIKLLFNAYQATALQCSHTHEYAGCADRL